MIVSLSKLIPSALLTAAVVLGITVLWGSAVLAAKSGSFEARLDRLAQAGFSPAAQQSLNAPGAGESSRPVTVALIPAFHHISHGALKTVIEGTPLKSRSGRSRLGSVILTATKPVNEYFSLSWIYQYTFGKYKGGLLVPDLPIVDGYSNLNLSSSMTGLIGGFYLGQAGRLTLSFMAAWDSFSGRETLISPAGSETRSVGRRDTRLGSLTLWWEKDFNLSQGLTLTPYAGWRSVRACLRGLAVWSEPDGTTSTQNAWRHMVSGGMTLRYSQGPFNFKLWSGYNQITKKGNVPGFASRTYAPNVANLGWMNNWDRGVWAYGFSLSRPVAKGLVLSLAYDGAKGPHTLSQSGSTALVWLF